MTCPLFRCLPSDGRAKIDYHVQDTLGGWSVPVFNRMMFMLDASASWQDAAPIVGAYNRLMRERGAQRHIQTDRITRSKP